MSNKNGNQSPAQGQPLTATQTSLRGIFADVYRFILQAVNGDRATADRLFEDFLNGKLSEQLLSFSRDCVSADQASSFNRNVEEGVAERPEQRGALEVSDDALSF